MIAEELRRAKAIAAQQAQERNARHETRSLPKPISSNSLLDSKLQTSETMTTTTSSGTSIDQSQIANIINSIPIFSDESKDNINDWLEIVSLKFDMLSYDPNQKRRFIPQYLAGNALKWHMAHRDDLSSWDEYTEATIDAFPVLTITSRDMNLQLLKDRKQSATESFFEYYSSILDLCRKHDPDMTDNHIVDWLKAGMNLNLYEKLQGAEFTTSQVLLVHSQRLELDNAVLSARKRECPPITPVLPTFLPYYGTPKRSNQSTYYPPSSPSTQTPPYPPLMPNTASNFHPMFSSQASPNPYSRPPIVCYKCHQPGHISPHCPSLTSIPSASPRRAIFCYSCGQPGHISPHCPYYPKE